MASRRLVGRGCECETIAQLLAMPAVQNSVRLIRGEPGLGKSALLDHAAGLAAANGIRTLSTTGVETEAAVPYAGLHQLLRPRLGDVDGLEEPQRSAIRVALGMQPGEPPSQFTVALAVLQLVSDAAPVLLLVEDAH